MTVEFGSQETAAAEHLIDLALEEDLQQIGDITSQSTIPAEAVAAVDVTARDSGRLAGNVLTESVYKRLCHRMQIDDGCITVEQLAADGCQVESGQVVARIQGPVRLLLTGERIALNFLIHLSGIASRTAEFVARANGTQVDILDTRKTIPGYRLLHKYAVRCGGGTNHRMGLFDGMLIKDNHLAARNDASVATAVAAARRFLAERSLQIPIEIEVDTLEQLLDALRERPDIVLLDNMSTSELKQAVRIRDEASPETQLEASGGVNLDSIGCIAASGVDRISIGGLTHSAPALDLGFDWHWLA